MQDTDDTGQKLAEAPRTIIVAPARTHAVPFEEKQRRTRELLGWNDSILAGQVSPSTRKQYTEDFFDYLRFARSAQEALDSAIFSQWRTDLVERIYLVPDRASTGEMVEKQLSPNTINRMLAAVRHMMMEAEEKKLVSPGTFEQFNRVRGVSVKGLKDRLKPNARVRITPQEMRLLTQQPDASRLLGLRDLALLHTFGNGPRISEICDITRNRLHPRGRGYVVEVRGKNKTEYRDVPLTREAYAAIQAWLASRPVDSPYIFTRFDGRGEDAHARLSAEPLTRQGAWKIIKGYAVKIGLPDAKPHDLRRLVGTELARKNPRIGQLVLGHASIETFYKHYVLDELPEDATEGLY
ncbi:MAG: tyrosine-type recombinase/integrase [Ktedonobacteraceae bacterium]